MGSFSIWHWLIVLVIVMLVFGTKKLRNTTCSPLKVGALSLLQPHQLELS